MVRFIEILVKGYKLYLKYVQFGSALILVLKFLCSFVSKECATLRALLNTV